MTEVSGWEAFGSGLTETLREVSDRVFLVVFSRAQPRVFVQFAGGEHELHAEAAAPTADPGRMTAAGWVPPTGDDPPNWTFFLPLPALTVEYAALAARCVVALRDTHGLTTPDGLVHKAWRDAEWPSSATPSAERDPGENPLPLPWLGIPPASG
ncbi:TY-Chap domain-containing protein [Amycolatopsis magusensis]|uniref:TY-Chap domain-containing protein n=1 Tax=Amycolatopsis magusensis TaxID=882444 RepID=UPI003C2B0C12